MRISFVIFLALITCRSYCSEGHLVLQTKQGPLQRLFSPQYSVTSHPHILDIFWSPDERFLTTLSITRLLATYETRTGKQISGNGLEVNGEIADFRANDFIQTLAWGENEIFLVGTKRGALVAFSHSQNKLICSMRINLPGYTLKEIRHCGNNDFIVTFVAELDSIDPNFSKIMLYRVSDCSLHTILSLLKGISATAYNSESKMLAVATRMLRPNDVHLPSGENRLKIIPLGLPQVTSDLPQEDFFSLHDEVRSSFPSEVRTMQWINKTQLAAALTNGTIVLYDVQKKERVCEIQLPETATVTSQLSISVLGHYLALGGKNKVFLFNLFKKNDSKEPTPVSLHDLSDLSTCCNALINQSPPLPELFARAVAWAPASNRLALALDDNSLENIIGFAHTLIILDLSKLELFSHLFGKLSDRQYSGRLTHFTPDRFKLTERSLEKSRSHQDKQANGHQQNSSSHT